VQQQVGKVIDSNEQQAKRLKNQAEGKVRSSMAMQKKRSRNIIDPSVLMALMGDNAFYQNCDTQ